MSNLVDPVKYEVITQSDDGDLLIPLPPPLIQALNWKNGDPIRVKWDNGRWIITKE